MFMPKGRKKEVRFAKRETHQNHANVDLKYHFQYIHTPEKENPQHNIQSSGPALK